MTVTTGDDKEADAAPLLLVEAPVQLVDTLTAVLEALVCLRAQGAQIIFHS